MAQQGTFGPKPAACFGKHSSTQPRSSGLMFVFKEQHYGTEFYSLEPPSEEPHISEAQVTACLQRPHHNDQVHHLPLGKVCLLLLLNTVTLAATEESAQAHFQLR